MRTAKPSFIRRMLLMLAVCGVMGRVAPDTWAATADETVVHDDLPTNQLGARVLDEKLFSAAAQGDPEKLRLLLDHGANVNARTRWAMTPLHAAQVHGNRHIVDQLVAAGADASIEMPSPGEFIDARVGELVQGESAGTAVLVSQRGKVLFKNGYGYANLEHRVPVTPRTKFRIGSVTKQFTAAAILQLQEKGKLSVDDPLEKFIADFPRGDEVRIHHLLHHTSGIRSYTDKPDFLNTVTAPVKPRELIDSFKNDPFDFSPGEGWHYNNSGYFLLGEIVAKVSGQSYAEYLRKHIFEPLGMNDTGVHYARDILRHEATGYSYEQGELKKALDWDMSRAGGAGAIYSTVEDLHTWNEAVFAGELLSKASQKAAFTPVELKEDVQGMSYGYGWMIRELRGLNAIQHGGGLQGFVSHLARYPEHDLTVAVLVNVAPPPPGLMPGSLAQEIAQYFLWESMEAREVRVADSQVNPDIYDDYTGRYDYGAAILTVTREGDRLFAQLTGQAKSEIFPRSETEFFWKVVDAQISFVRNEKGEVDRAIHRQGGQTIKARKLEAQPVVKVSAEVLQGYVGKYDYGGGGAMLTVTQEGDRLLAQMTGQPKFEIFPKSETEFFWKVVNAQVTFFKNEQGKVTKAVHRQGGREISAPKIE